MMAGRGALLVSPATASSVTNWGKAWKKEIKPRADKRYVTKGDARDRFAAKSSLGHYYTRPVASGRSIRRLVHHAGWMKRHWAR